jgi:hypothetical protein
VPDFSNLRLGEFRATTARARCPPAASGHVGHVLAMIANIEMRNVDAGAIIATVQYLLLVWYRAILKCPGETMSAIFRCLPADSHRKLPVTVVGIGAHP